MNSSMIIDSQHIAYFVNNDKTLSLRLDVRSLYLMMGSDDKLTATTTTH